MNGDYEEDEDGFDEFRAAPHPDDRLWRHPSEIAAMAAAHANAETAKVPVVELSQPESKSRIHAGLKMAAGIVVVGAAALTIGVVSSSPDPQGNQLTSETVTIAPATGATFEDASGEDATGERQDRGGTEFAAEVAVQGEDILTARIHDQVAASLPRIQAVTSNGMREGSGMFVTDDGHIATSAELINDAEYVLAWTEDGQRWKAHLIASDNVSDVAVIQIESHDWPSVALSNGDAPRSGQYALAIDHFDDSISVGEVTGVSSPQLIIDQRAAMPGSAIVDDTGAVIAMITGDGTNSRGIRSWMLEQVAVDLIASGETSHNVIGLVVRDDPSVDMVVVDDVLEGSPAAEAGLRAGDLIDTFDGNPVVDAASLFEQVQRSSPGDNAVLTVTRNTSRRIVLVTVGLAP